MSVRGSRTITTTRTITNRGCCGGTNQTTKRRITGVLECWSCRRRSGSLNSGRVKISMLTAFLPYSAIADLLVLECAAFRGANFVPEGQADSSQARSAWIRSLDISKPLMWVGSVCGGPRKLSPGFTLGNACKVRSPEGALGFGTRLLSAPR
jgi:hypothetical protein